jgi:hypothetical protein
MPDEVAEYLCSDNSDNINTSSTIVDETRVYVCVATEHEKTIMNIQAFDKTQLKRSATVVKNCLPTKES